MANGPVPRTLTRAQQARRQRVVDAAMSLALDGGYEAVQMRDVAAGADGAMGTVYRYFTSKDHLLAAALVHWVEQLDSRLAQLPAQGATAAQRVIDVLDRALRAMGRPPTPAGPAGSPPETGGSRLHRVGLSGPRGHRMPTAGGGPDGRDHHPGHRGAPAAQPERQGPHHRPRLVLGTGRVGQRLEEHAGS